MTATLAKSGIAIIGLALTLVAVGGCVSDEDFTETSCGPFSFGSEFYIIELEASNGIQNRLEFNNSTINGLLVFSSTSLKYHKWVTDLPNFEAFEYRADGYGSGLLSTTAKTKNRRIEFGMISEDCWNGLRAHLKGLVPTVETTIVAKNIRYKSETVYFGNFAGYHIPLKLVERLSRSEALSRPAYLIGYYDDGGKLYRVEKYDRGDLFFRHDYTYHANGELKESRTVNADGKVIEQFFDESGNPVENN